MTEEQLIALLGRINNPLPVNPNWTDDATKNSGLGPDMKVEIRLHGGLLSGDFAKFNVFERFYPNLHDKFDEYPNMLGFFIVDEPSFGQLDVVDNLYVPWFNEHYANGNLQFFVNMLSGYSTAMGGLRDINGNLVTNNGTYKTGGNINALYEGSPAYSVAQPWKQVTVKLTDKEKEDMTVAYHNKWLGILKKVKSEHSLFSHDAYPFFDNQLGKMLVTDAVDQNGNVVWTKEDLYNAYLDANMGWKAEDMMLELPDDYDPYLQETWLSRSLNMAILARDNGYGFGACIQTFDQGGTGYETHKWRLPTTVAEIKWQVYMNLAMGARKIDYFGYDQSGNGAYMTLAAKPTLTYYLVKETNDELTKIEHVFAAFDTWVGLKTFAANGQALSNGLQLVEDKGQNLDSLTNVTSVSSSRELVVGEMIDGDGNHGYMLVGYGDPLDGESTQVTMNFDGADGFIVYRGGERTLVEAVDGAYSATLAAGEGVFVIPVYVD